MLCCCGGGVAGTLFPALAALAMKGGGGAKEAKGDSGKQQKAACAPSSAGETAALFPRLHVKDKEKAGPRAPPRNKMALYEQLTIPSHRFVAPSLPLRPPLASAAAAAAAYPQQYFIGEYKYPYPTYYVQPTLGCVTVNAGSHSFVQPSTSVRSSSAVVDCDGESKSVHDSQSTDRPSNVSVQTTTPVHASCKSLSGKKVKRDDDLVVSTFSAERTNRGSLDKSFHQASERCHISCASPSNNLARSSAGIPFSSIADYQQEASVPCSANVGIDGVSNEKQDEEVHLPGQVKPLDGYYENQPITPQGFSSSQSDANEGSYLPQHSNSHQPFNRECNVKSVHVAGTASQCSGLGECVTTTGYEFEHKKEMMSFKKCSGDLEYRTANVALPVLDDHGFNRLQEPANVIMEDKLGLGTCSPQLKNLENSFGNGCKSVSDSEDPSNGSSEVSEQSLPCQENDSDDSDSSMLDSVSVPKIMPKDVVQIVGQRQFWKTRRSILRQQRIFSEQVFELHKLIQVQQMLAAIPDFTLKDDLNCSLPAVIVRDDINPPTSGMKGNVVVREALNHGASINDDKVYPQQELQPGVTCYPNWNGYGGTQMWNHAPYLGPFPAVPTVMAGGVNVWGFPYPSLGAGQFLGPIAAQPGPFVYQPTAGVFSSPRALAGPYDYFTHSGTQHSVSASFTACDQPPELPQDVYTRYVPPVTGHTWQSAIMPVGPASSATWYPMQASVTKSMQSDPVNGNQQEFPSGPIASDSYKPENSAQTSKETLAPASVAPLPSPWMSRITGQSETRGLNWTASESDKSALPTHEKNASRTVVADEHAGSHFQRERCWTNGWESAGAYCPQVPDSYANEVFQTNNGLARDSKRHKEALREDVANRGMDGRDADADESTGQSQNALPLFPVAPGSNMRDTYGRKYMVQAEDRSRVIRAVPRAAVAASKSAAGILLSIQQERQQ